MGVEGEPTSWKQKGLALIGQGLGVLCVAGLGLYTFLMTMATAPLHPNPQDVPSVTRADGAARSCSEGVEVTVTGGTPVVCWQPPLEHRAAEQVDKERSDDETSRADALALHGRHGRRPAATTDSLFVVDSTTTRSTVVFHEQNRSVLGPQWSPTGDDIVFGIGHFGAFFNGFHDLFLKKSDRVDGGAQVATIKADGSGFREVTTGPNNNGFPSMSPDGTRVVYRTFGPDGDGLRVMTLRTRAVSTLTNGYDNFPVWSPKGDLIMFSRIDQGDYEIYSITPDGTGLRRLTHSPGNDAHQGWSPDGEHIVFSSSRMGFKDEVTR